MVRPSRRPPVAAAPPRIEGADPDARLRALAEAEDDVRQGRTVGHDTVRDWLVRAAAAARTGTPLPPPPVARGGNSMDKRCG